MQPALNTRDPDDLQQVSQLEVASAFIKASGNSTIQNSLS